jgi:SNF2 family DNA or RNA helicase
MNNINENNNNRTLLDEDSEQIEQPPNLKKKLFIHQKTLVHKLGQIEQTRQIICNNDIIINTNIVVVSDLIGSGKTLSMISLILTQPKPKPFRLYTTITDSSFYSCFTQNKESATFSNLIIVSHSLLKQWEDTIQLSNLTYFKVNNSKSLNDLNFDNITDNKIILLSVNFLTQFMMEWFNDPSYKWDRIIIDEAHNIKLPSNRSIYTFANFIYLICATPNELFYNTSNQTIKYLIGKNMYSSYYYEINKIRTFLCVQNKDSFVNKSISLPDIKKEYIKCFTPAIVNYFRDSLPEKALELFNAGCSQDAIEILNCKVDTSTNIIKSLTKYYEDKLHDLQHKQNYYNTIHNISNSERDNKLKSLKTEITKINDIIDGIKKRILSINSEYCPICLDSFTKPVASNCCKNIFCMECILKCTKNAKLQCPFCRINIDTKSLHLIDNENNLKITTKNNKNDPTKLETLINILKNLDDKKRVLVFSNYDNTFKSIKDELSKYDIKYDILKGSSSHINNVIDKYKSGVLQVILLNSNNFGSGLNLEMTTDIIIYHKLSKDHEMQAIGRGQRLGRTDPLTVTYLTHTNEY